MHGFQKFSSMYDNLEQTAKQKELNGREEDLRQLTVSLSNLPLHYGEGDETTLEQ